MRLVDQNGDRDLLRPGVACVNIGGGTHVILKRVPFDT